MPRILDTKHLGWFYATDAVLPELRASGVCEIPGELAPIGLDEAGRLTDALPP